MIMLPSFSETKGYFFFRFYIYMCVTTDPIITWVVPYEQISIDQQKAAWFMNGTSKVEKQHPIQNTVTLRPAGAKTEEERKNQFNCFACCFPCNDGRIE